MRNVAAPSGECPPWNCLSKSQAWGAVGHTSAEPFLSYKGYLDLDSQGEIVYGHRENLFFKVASGRQKLKMCLCWGAPWCSQWELPWWELAGISPSSHHGLQSAIKLRFSRVGKAFTLLDCLINSLVGSLFRLSTFVMFWNSMWIICVTEMHLFYYVGSSICALLKNFAQFSA